MESKQAPLAIRFDTALLTVNQLDAVIHRDKQRQPVHYPLIYLPLYLVERLNDIVKSYLEKL